MDMELAPLFNNIVYNSDPVKAYEQIKAVLLKEMEAK